MHTHNIRFLFFRQCKKMTEIKVSHLAYLEHFWIFLGFWGISCQRADLALVGTWQLLISLERSVPNDSDTLTFFFYTWWLKKSSFKHSGFGTRQKGRMCDRVHRSRWIFWGNKLAAWLFGVMPRLLGSNPAPWKDKDLDAILGPL